MLEVAEDDVEVLSVSESSICGNRSIATSAPASPASTSPLARVRKERSLAIRTGACFSLEGYLAWKRAHGLDPGKKVFIVDAALPAIKNTLLGLGWVENCWDPGGPWFDFKWTIKVSEIDYTSLRSPQLVNHFERSKEFITKAGLNSHLKAALEAAAFDVNALYPHSFLLLGQDELEEFKLEFKLRKAEGVLRKWVKHVANGKSGLETFSDDLVQIALEVTERRVLDIDNHLITDINEAEYHGIWVTDEEWSVLAEVDVNNPGKELQQLRRMHACHDEEESLRKLRRRQAKEAFERRAEELRKTQERFCKKNLKRATSVPGRATIRKDLTVVGPPVSISTGFANPGSSAPTWLQDSQDTEDSRHNNDITLRLPVVRAKPEIQGARLEGAELLSRVCAVLDMLRASDGQFAMSGSRNIWVLKPHDRARAEGIFLSSDLEEILHCAASQRCLSSWICQKYIENPLLIGDRKHDLRQWVLVTSWNPLTVYIFSEVYVRLASEQFSFEDIKNRAEHLTNLCDRSVWDQEAYQGFLHKQFSFDAWEERVLPAIKRAIVSTLQCVQSDLLDSTAAGCCFELLGYDFMVDDTLQVWLLEINASPAMKYDNAVLARLVPAVLRDCLRVVGLSGNDQPPCPPCFYRLETANLVQSFNHLQSDAMVNGLSINGQRLERPCPQESSLPTLVEKRTGQELQEFKEKLRMRQEKEQQRREKRQRLIEGLRRAGKKAWQTASMPSLRCTEAEDIGRDTKTDTSVADTMPVLPRLIEAQEGKLVPG